MTEDEFYNVLYFEDWLVVLASPRILQAMQRVPPREHLLRMLDMFLSYARSKRRFMSRAGEWKPDPQRREARALELRVAIERWNSPEISREITQAARAFLREDGEDFSDEEWDAYEIESPPDDYLMWPEGIPLAIEASRAIKPDEPPVSEERQADAPVSDVASGRIWGSVPRPPFRQEIEDEGVDAHPMEKDFADIFHFQHWLHVLASPRILQAMRRMPTQEHLLIMLDAYLPYARSERRLRDGEKIWYPDPQKREACALALRAAMERWSSSAISSEITQAARALLREDGICEPEEGWDAYVVESEPPVENYLVWPESPQYPPTRKAKG